MLAYLDDAEKMGVPVLTEYLSYAVTLFKTYNELL